MFERYYNFTSSRQTFCIAQQVIERLLVRRVRVLTVDYSKLKVGEIGNNTAVNAKANALVS